METLLGLYRETADRKYLEPLPRAIAYYRRSLLPDGRLARFYELETNRPLYFTRDYRLTYEDGDLPGHYAFKVASRLDAIEREYVRLAALEPGELATERFRAERRSVPGEEEVRRVIGALDEKGRWVDAGALPHRSRGEPLHRERDVHPEYRDPVPDPGRGEDPALRRKRRIGSGRGSGRG